MTDRDDALGESLARAVGVDEAVREAMTPEVMSVPAVEVDGSAVLAPGKMRLIEDVWLARRTFSAIHYLMEATNRATTPAADFTESAAVLVRRLLELLAQTSWLTDYDPPPGIGFPAPLGNPDEMSEMLPSMEEPQRSHMIAYLASVRDWIDVQAMRAQRSELTQQRKTVAALTGDAERQQTELRDLSALDDAIVSRLDSIGVETSERHDNVSILRRMRPDYVVLYRYESDVTHAGAIGRTHQRGRDDEPMLGAPATANRRRMVIDSAISAVLEIARRALWALDADATSLDEHARSHKEAVAAASAGDE